MLYDNFIFVYKILMKNGTYKNFDDRFDLEISNVTPPKKQI